MRGVPTRNAYFLRPPGQVASEPVYAARGIDPDGRRESPGLSLSFTPSLFLAGNKGDFGCFTRPARPGSEGHVYGVEKREEVKEAFRKLRELWGAIHPWGLSLAERPGSMPF